MSNSILQCTACKELLPRSYFSSNQLSLRKKKRCFLCVQTKRIAPYHNLPEANVICLKHGHYAAMDQNTIFPFEKEDTMFCSCGIIHYTNKKMREIEETIREDIWKQCKLENTKSSSRGIKLLTIYINQLGSLFSEDTKDKLKLLIMINLIKMTKFCQGENMEQTCKSLRKDLQMKQTVDTIIKAVKILQQFEQQKENEPGGDELFFIKAALVAAK